MLPTHRMAKAHPSSPARTSPAPRPRGTPTKPRLLSGGPKSDGDPAVQAYIAAMPACKREVGQRLDALITRAVPNVRKAVRWNTPFYGIEGQGWFLAFHCITKYVKVAFLNGSCLSPLPPVESKHPATRYLHIHEPDWGTTLDEKLLVNWIRQAAKLPGEKLF